MNTYEISTITVLHILSQLTPYELDILDLISHGKSSGEIAETMCSSLNTMDGEIKLLLKKFGKENTSQIAEMLNEIKVLDVLIRK